MAANVPKRICSVVFITWTYGIWTDTFSVHTCSNLCQLITVHGDT